MILYTLNRRYASSAIQRLERQHISYILQPAGTDTVNLFLAVRSASKPYGW